MAFDETNPAYIAFRDRVEKALPRTMLTPAIRESLRKENTGARILLDACFCACEEVVQRARYDEGKA